MKPVLRATFEIQCSDLTDVLCRTLDHARRMGMTLHNIRASSSAETGTAEISLSVNDPDQFSLLANRVRQIPQMPQVTMLLDDEVCPATNASP